MIEKPGVFKGGSTGKPTIQLKPYIAYLASYFQENTFRLRFHCPPSFSGSQSVRLDLDNETLGDYRSSIEKQCGMMNPMSKLICVFLGILTSLVFSVANAGEEQNQEDYDCPFCDEISVLLPCARHCVFLPSYRFQEFRESSSSITVITRADIQDSGATTIPEILRLATGVEVMLVSMYSAHVSSRLHRTRDTFNYLIMVNGWPVETSLLGQPNWENLAVFIDDIFEIEVIRGPASHLYGEGALAGIINIQTGAIDKRDGAYMTVSGGEAGRSMIGGYANVMFGRCNDWKVTTKGRFGTAGSFWDPMKDNELSWNLGLSARYDWGVCDYKNMLIEGGISGAPLATVSKLGRTQASVETRHLRITAASESLFAGLSWKNIPIEFTVGTPLMFRQFELAAFIPATANANVLDGKITWRIFTFPDSFILTIGSTGRLYHLDSGNLLDSNAIDSSSSTRPPRPGVSYWEGRVGAFVHGEYELMHGLTLTADLRADYITDTGFFISPRIATLFKVHQSIESAHFIRLSSARAFRKPDLLGNRFLPSIEISYDSPIPPGAHGQFERFLLWSLCDEVDEYEQLLSFEASYVGEFFGDALTVSLDLYTNFHTFYQPEFSGSVLDGEFPDVAPMPPTKTIVDFDRYVFGGELTLRFHPSNDLSLVAAWSHREVFNPETDEWEDQSPTDMVLLGGHFRGKRRLNRDGFVGSLYAVFSSGFRDVGVMNPGGYFMESIDIEVENTLIFMGRIGWRRYFYPGGKWEAGIRLFLPVRISDTPRIREIPGGFTAAGQRYGGDSLRRVVSFYLHGEF